MAQLVEDLELYKKTVYFLQRLFSLDLMQGYVFCNEQLSVAFGAYLVDDSICAVANPFNSLVFSSV